MTTARIEMSFVQRETWRVSRGDGVDAAECPFCRTSSPMIAAETLAKLARTSPREIYRCIDEGRLHFYETHELEVLVCLTSFSEMKPDAAISEAFGQIVECSTSLRRM